MTRSWAPFPDAVRIYDSADLHFRNVLVNAESGFAACDKNGCGTFLRKSKFPFANAIEDMVFGGADHRTLFILSHHALFAVKVRGA